MTLEHDPGQVPAWLGYVVAAVLGGGGVKYLRAWLESRALRDREVRETLMERIAQLEQSVGFLHGIVADLRAENAELRVRLERTQ